MKEMIRKTYVVPVKAIDDEPGMFEATVSTGGVDRDNEVIEPAAFSKRLGSFLKHNVLLSSHCYFDLRSQIGEVPAVAITPQGMNVKLRYYVGQGNEEADWGAFLASRGKAAYSVGFIPHKWDDGDGEKEPRRTYTDVELLEISHVCIGSNRDALVAARAKGLGAELDAYVDEVLGDFPQEEALIPTMKVEPIFEEFAAVLGKTPDELTDLERKEAIFNAVLSGKHINVEPVLRPYPNEHSCRLEDPDKFERCIRKHVKDTNEIDGYKPTGKPYDLIICYDENEKSAVQAHRYKKDVWSADEARAHCKAHDGAFAAAREEEKDISEMLSETAESPQVSGGYVRVTGETPGTLTWRTTVWPDGTTTTDNKIDYGATTTDSRTDYGTPLTWSPWIPDNGTPAQPDVHFRLVPDEIIDELDYLKDLLATRTLPEEAKELAREVAALLQRATADETGGLDIKRAALSAKNKEILKQAIALIQGVLDSAEPHDEEGGKGPSQEELAEKVVQALKQRFNL